MYSFILFYRVPSKNVKSDIFARRLKIAELNKKTSVLVTMIAVSVCGCLGPSTVKVSSVQGWNSRGQINDVFLKTILSSAKSLHRYFSMKHLAFLTSHFIMFTHQKREKPRLIQLYVLLAFKNMRPSATIIRHRLRSALHREPTCLWRQHSREVWQSN